MVDPFAPFTLNLVSLQKNRAHSHSRRGEMHSQQPRCSGLSARAQLGDGRGLELAVG